MKRAIALALILLAALIQSASPAQAGHAVKFYVFGSMGCPACRHLKEVLVQAYGEDSIAFREVSVREDGEKMLAPYSIIYPEMREYPIPLTIIVVDGEPAGSAIGAMEADFWQYMVNESLKTGKFMVAGSEGTIYVAERDPKKMAEIAEIIGLNASTPAAITPTTRSPTPTASPPPIEAATPTATPNADNGSSAAQTNYAALIAGIAFLTAIIAFNMKKGRRR